MKAWFSVFIILCLLVGCSKSGDNKEGDNKEKDKGPIEETIDYGTGKTQLTAGQKAKAQIIQISIGNAVNSFEVLEGRRPNSLQELVDAGLLNKKHKQDEWGRDLITSVQGNKLIVRSVGADKKPNTSDDWVKEY